MDDVRLAKVSKFLGKHLRRKPDAIGLILQLGGWVGWTTSRQTQRRRAWSVRGTAPRLASPWTPQLIGRIKA